MRKLLLAAVCLAGGALAQTAPAPIGAWVFATGSLDGRRYCNLKSGRNSDGWQLGVSSGGTHLHLHHTNLRIPMRDVGEAGFMVSGRERISFQFLGSEFTAGSFVASSPQRVEHLLSTSRVITLEIPRFGPQQFDVAGYAEARRVCPN